MRKEGKRKALAALVCGSMLTVALVGGTLAYLQAEDSDVNVMTLGNVAIEQHEYERATNDDGTYKTDTIDNQTSYVLQGFTQAKPLLPIVGDPNEPGDSPAYAGWDDTIVRMTQVDSYGSMQVFAGKNAQDKFVTVENTGRTDAYVRTLVAIEIGSTDGRLIMTSARAAQAADATSTAPWIESSVDNIEIDGNNYRVVEYVYRGASDVDRHVNGVLPAGDTSYPSLCQVYLKHNATNEDMEAIDGNGNGTLDILVLSQAVQVEGFADAQTALDTAFGKASEKAAEWFGGMKVPTAVKSAEELTAALAAGDANILYTGTEPLVIDAVSPVTGNVTISSAGAAFEAAESSVTVKDGGSLSFENITIKAGGASRAICVEDGGEVVFGEGAEIVADSALAGDFVVAYSYTDGVDAKVVLDGVKISGLDNGGKGSLFDIGYGAILVIENGTVISGNKVSGASGTPYGLFEVTSGGELIMNGGEISGNEFAKALFNVGGGKFTMNGGSITGNTLTGSSGFLFFNTGSCEVNGGEISGNNLNGSPVFMRNATLNGGVVS